MEGRREDDHRAIPILHSREDCPFAGEHSQILRVLYGNGQAGLVEQVRSNSEWREGMEAIQDEERKDRKERAHAA